MEKAKKRGGVIVETTKAIVIAVLLSLLLVLVAALVIKLCNLPTSAIPIINQVIKGVSILTGTLIALKSKQNTWIKGIVIGVLYIALAYVIFSLLDGNFDFGLSLLNDIVLGSVTGMVSGILAGFKK